MMKGKFPGCVLLVELPRDMVDVNVHPAKTIVKFVGEKRVFDLVYHAVMAALDKREEAERPQPKPASQVQNPRGDFFANMTSQQYRESRKTAEKPAYTPAGARPVSAPQSAPVKPAPAPQWQTRVPAIDTQSGGKAALWCAAQDERVCGVLVNDSGCSGAAVSRGKHGETVGSITAAFPHWFCKNYQKYAWKEETLPFDQHQLVACVAPRLCYITSGSEDRWSDPDAEWNGAKSASCAWELFGDAPLPSQPPANDSGYLTGRIGYHRRTGGHDITRWDWAMFLRFLDFHNG